MPMEIWILIPLYVFVAIGLFLTAAGLFGNTVVYVSILIYSILTGFTPVGWGDLLVITLLYLSGELLEYVFTLLGVKWLGASRLAGWMAILGTIIGATFGGAVFWVVGIIVGGFIGAMLGALITELLIKKNIGLGIKAGFGAFLGKAGSMFVKLIIAIIMVVYLVKVISSG